MDAGSNVAPQVFHKRHPQNRLSLTPDTIKAIEKVRARARKTARTADIRLRLPNGVAEALAKQARFSESCMDELPPTARHQAPNPLTFLELALDLEASINDSNQQPQAKRPTPICHVSRKPMGADGHASVDISDGVTIAIYRHTHCTAPR